FNNATGETRRVRSTFIPKEDRPKIARAIGASRSQLEPPPLTPAPAGRVEQAALYDAEDRAPKAPPRPAPAPAPEPSPAESGPAPEWVTVLDLPDLLEQGEVYSQFDGDPNVVQLTAAEES